MQPFKKQANSPAKELCQNNSDTGSVLLSLHEKKVT